jgi:hypothetical protein
MNPGLTSIAKISEAGDLDFAAQGAPDEFGNAQLLAPRYLGQTFLDLAGQAERHRDTALRQFRSGHASSVLLHHTHCQGRKFLPSPPGYDTVGGVRDKESTAITITLPVVLDRALQALADQKHCGNKSAAIREVLYKEAGMKAKLRMNEKSDNVALAKAEHRAVKYGSRKKKSRK